MNLVVTIASCICLTFALSTQPDERTEWQKKADVFIKTVKEYRDKMLDTATNLIDENKPLLNKITDSFHEVGNQITTGITSLKCAWHLHQRKRDQERIAQLEQDLALLREKHSQTNSDDNQPSFIKKIFKSR